MVRSRASSPRARSGPPTITSPIRDIIYPGRSRSLTDKGIISALKKTDVGHEPGNDDLPELWCALISPSTGLFRSRLSSPRARRWPPTNPNPRLQSPGTPTQRHQHKPPLPLDARLGCATRIIADVKAKILPQPSRGISAMADVSTLLSFVKANASDKRGPGRPLVGCRGEIALSSLIFL